MKKGNIVALSIIVIFACLLAVPLMTMEDVPILKVTAVVSVTDGSPEIKNVTVDQEMVNPLKALGRNSNAGFPGVEAKAIINFGSGGVSDWGVKDYRGNGTYEFVIGFSRGVMLERGDHVRVIVKVVDEKEAIGLLRQRGQLYIVSLV